MAQAMHIKCPQPVSVTLESGEGVKQMLHWRE